MTTPEELVAITELLEALLSPEDGLQIGTYSFGDIVFENSFSGTLLRSEEANQPNFLPKTPISN